MQLFEHYRALAIFTILLCEFHIVDASTTTNVTPLTSPVVVTVSPILNGTCESRTINYITTPSSVSVSETTVDLSSPTMSELIKSGDGMQSIASMPVPTISASLNILANASFSKENGSESEGVLDESAFLSFEDWKKQRLEKQELSDTASGEQRGPGGIPGTLEVLGDDEGEIETDFGVFLGHRHSAAASGPQEDSLSRRKPVQNAADGDMNGGHPNRRGKDAGKTCKERFNFASIDAGGQIMKTNPEAKSASALLSENQDIYMLNICQAKNKFLIIELSELILVETMAIANFEFFSSTFRLFRISVSDRYPVKLDQWVELGTFEAKNSRDIQAFLVKDSRIWARYIRVEFLSHYGNEFYCPVSLLRVHGRTMIQEIQDTLIMEQSSDREDDTEDLRSLRASDGEILIPEAVANNNLGEEEKVVEHLKGAQQAPGKPGGAAVEITSQRLDQVLDLTEIKQIKHRCENVSMGHATTSWTKPDLTSPTVFDKSSSADMCLLLESSTTFQMAHGKLLANIAVSDRVTYMTKSETSLSYGSSILSMGPQASAVDHKLVKESLVLSSTQNASSTGPSLRAITPTSAHPITNMAENVTVTGINKSSVASTAHISQPTTQESFFKSVSKRLQQLEANSTLSLKYIEEQSRILRDAFTKVEKRQLSKTTSFLETLNDTVLEELRKFNRQYDQIWQSTVIELETQRDQSQREIAAVSTRLNILADELVFQKRMSIIQSVLLLLCLGLVIFSRGLHGLDMPIIQNIVTRSQSASKAPFDNLPNNSSIQSGNSSPDGRPWLGTEHGRHMSKEFALSMSSLVREDPSPIPFLAYSRREDHLSCGNQDNPMRGTRKGLLVNHNGNTSDNSPSPGINETDFQNHRMAPLHDRGEYLGFGGFRPRTLGNSNENVDEHVWFVTDSPQPLEAESPEFSISRKPLPALPKDNL